MAGGPERRRATTGGQLGELELRRLTEVLPILAQTRSPVLETGNFSDSLSQPSNSSRSTRKSRTAAVHPSAAVLIAAVHPGEVASKAYVAGHGHATSSCHANARRTSGGHDPCDANDARRNRNSKDNAGDRNEHTSVLQLNSETRARRPLAGPRLELPGRPWHVEGALGLLPLCFHLLSLRSVGRVQTEATLRASTAGGADRSTHRSDRAHRFAARALPSLRASAPANAAARG